MNTSWERGKRAQRGIKKRKKEKGERKEEREKEKRVGYQYFIPSRERHLKTGNGESCMHINERGHRCFEYALFPPMRKKGISLTIGAPPLRGYRSQEISDTVAFDDWTNYQAWLYFIVSSFILTYVYIYKCTFFSFVIPSPLFSVYYCSAFVFEIKEIQIRGTML